jgi:hypothetical protein
MSGPPCPPAAGWLGLRRGIAWHGKSKARREQGEDQGKAWLGMARPGKA